MSNLERLTSNVTAVRQRIADAAKKSGRSENDVRLVAVTKYVDAQTTAELVAAGCDVLGENRPQVLWEKADQLSDLSIDWHLIGHLQRNKVTRTIPLTSLIHSVDSLRLINAINNSAESLARKVAVLLEINVSGEAAKHGFSPEELGSALDHVSGLENVSVHGLMAMAGLAGDSDDARREFVSLRELAQSHSSATSENIQLTQLSMGMSGDFEIAIEEGATLVRVGSLLLEGCR